MNCPKFRVAPFLVAFGCLGGFGPAYAQRGLVPRGFGGAREAPSPRFALPPREDRPSFLNALAASFLFSNARVEEVPACSPDSPENEDRRAAAASVMTPGVSLYALESRPYGSNGVGVFTFFVSRDEPGPVRVEGNPELGEWIGKTADIYKAHKVHLDWGKVLAKRYVRMFKNITNPKVMLLNIISTDLTIGALSLSPSLEITQAVLNCSAFAVETAITAATVQGSLGLASAITLGSWISSGYQCFNSLTPLFKGVSAAQQSLEAARAEQQAGESGGGAASGGGHGHDHGDSPPRDHLGSGSPKSGPSPDKSPSPPERSKPDRSTPERSKPDHSKPDRSGSSHRDITGIDRDLPLFETSHAESWA